VFNYVLVANILAMSVDVYLLSSYRGWIMEAIPREAAEAITLKVKFRYLPIGFRDAFRYENFISRIRFRKPTLSLYMHHTSFLQHRISLKSPTRLYLTHFDDTFVLSKEDVRKFCRAQKILVQNRDIESKLISFGIPSDKIQIVYGAVSDTVYYPSHDNSILKSAQVLIVGDCKPRKNPQLVEETIRKNPQFNFIIHGKNWERHTTLSQDPPKNLEILKFNPSAHPQLLRESSTLLSLATNEGGPYPIIEALASGTPVVATATGFAPDLLNETNGILLPLVPTQKEISNAIDRSILLKNETWDLDMTNGNLSWETLGNSLFR